MSFDLGGISVAFLPPPGETLPPPAAAYVPFITTAPPQVVFAVHRGPYPGELPARLIFDAGNWTSGQVGASTVIRMRFAAPPPGSAWMVACLEEDFTRGDIYLGELMPGPEDSPEVAPPFPPMDSVLAIHLLAAERGLLLHACGLRLDQGFGLLFSGVSGAGKSTLARLWQAAGGACILSDERVALRQQDGRFYLHGTPWHSDGAPFAPGTAPLERFFIIRHALHNAARPLEPSEALPLLLARAYLPFWDAAGMSFSLALLDRLCQQVPCFELGFVPDASVVDFLLRQVGD